MSIKASSAASPLQKHTNARISSPYYTLSDYGSYCCQLCGNSYSCESDFNQHSATHFNLETLTCLLCQHKYANKRNLRYHMNEHHASGQWECEICSAILGTRYSLKVHMEIHSDEKEFRCALCDKRLSCANSLRRHMVSHAQPKHKCALCVKSFGLRQNLLRHMQSVHGGYNDKRYKCVECDLDFKTAGHLKRHKLTQMTKNLFTCPFCLKSIMGKCQLDEHLFRHHRDDDAQTEDDVNSPPMHVPTKNSPFPLKGEFCQPNRYFANTEDVKYRLAHHYDCGGMCCDICKKRFASKFLLQQHLKCHNGAPEDNFECELCKNRFRSAALLRRHIRVNHHVQTARIFKCKVCQSSFSTDDQRIKHIRQFHNHVKGLNFPCSFCHDMFTSEPLLIDHVLTVHNKQMSFTCLVCKRQFKRRNSWIFHMMMQHPGGKLIAAETLLRQGDNNCRPYKCNECHLDFKSSQHLKCHKWKHTREKLFTCSICDKSVGTDRELKKHLFIHYRDDSDEPHNSMEKDENLDQPIPNSLLKVKCQLCQPIRYFTNADNFRCHLAHHFDSGNFCCHICKKHFDTEKLLHWHLKCHNCKVKRFFQCDFCEKRFEIKAMLQRHVMLSHEGPTARIFKCRLCKGAFASDQRRIKHISRVHSNVKAINFPCSFCDDQFPSESLLVQHLALHKQLKSFKCSACKLQWASKNSWIRHMLVQHSSELQLPAASKTLKHKGVRQRNNDKPHECDKCDRAFKTAWQLWCHTRGHAKEYTQLQIEHNYAKRPDFSVSFRDVIFTKKRTLTNRLAAAAAAHSDRSTYYACSACGEQFHSKTSWLNHTMVPNSKCRVLQCPVCKSSFRKEAKFDEHLLHAHCLNIRSLTCVSCSLTFVAKSSLLSHGSSPSHRQRAATATNGHQCNECAKVFKRKGYLTRHVQQVHQDEKPLICCICSKVFKIAADLKHHERFHNNPKDLEIEDSGNQRANTVDSLKRRITTKGSEYKCRKCNWKFMTSIALQVHNVLIHDGKAMYWCSACGRRFVDKVMLMLHCARFHRKSTSTLHECDFCEEGFVSDSQLKQHLQTHMS